MRPLGDKEARLIGEAHATLGPGDVFGEDALLGGGVDRSESATAGGSVVVIASLAGDELLASLKAYIEGEVASPAYLLRQAWCRGALGIEPDERGDAEMARVAHVLDR
jgi:CRP-like cAMP-binding protein